VPQILAAYGVTVYRLSRGSRPQQTEVRILPLREA